jgi:uncharacterized protein
MDGAFAPADVNTHLDRHLRKEHLVKDKNPNPSNEVTAMPIAVDEHMAQFRDAAERGDAEAQYQLGLGYVTSFDFEPNPGEALNWWRKAAAQLHPESLFTLGMWHAFKHLPDGDDEALYRFKYALEHRTRNARSYFGVTSLLNLDIPQTDTDATMWLYQAAKQEHLGGQLMLGWMHMRGHGVPKDSATAAAWFRKAAEQGDPLGQYTLGVMYSRGTGVPKDETQKAAWFRKAAEQGHPDAQYYLGTMYHKGAGGLPKDEREESAWYLKAAEQGHPYAEFALGLKYESGHGVPQDKAEAIKWFRLAAEHGEEMAPEKLRELGAEDPHSPNEQKE